MYQLISDIKIKKSNKKYTAIAVNIKSLNSKSHLDLFTLIDNLGKKGSINVKKDLHNFLKNKKKIKEVVNLNGDSLLSYNIK